MPDRILLPELTKDDVVWEKLEIDTDRWAHDASTEEVRDAVRDFIDASVGQTLKSCKSEKLQYMDAIRGGYNMVYRLRYKDKSSLVMKVPIQGLVNNPEDKILKEAGTMLYISEHFTCPKVVKNKVIPVPRIHHYGRADENPTGLGPFIIMDYIEHEKKMTEALRDPIQPLSSRPVLNPAISEEKLEFLYRQMARIILALASRESGGVGSYREAKYPDEVSKHQKRPTFLHQPAVTLNMNEVLIHTHAPPERVLPDMVSVSADDWYGQLAKVHMAQLIHQLNDAAVDEHDARDKYVARQLFYQLAVEGRLAQGLPTRLHERPKMEERFRFLFEDLRPGNILLDKDDCIVGVIDWEFVHSAPWQTTFDPPWWLLLLEPECWPGGPGKWMEACEPRLQIFLRAMEAEEKKMEEEERASANERDSCRNTEQTQVPLSQCMRESWNSKTILVNYAARKTFAFDYIWWKFLDEEFFGENPERDHRRRLNLLSEKQKEVMERFVHRKMKGEDTADIWDEIIG